MNSGDTRNPAVLIARFEEFIESAQRLETSHRELQDEVVRLRRELEERNRALEISLNEVEATRQVLVRVLETMPCGVVLLDAAGCTPLIANPEAQRLLSTPCTNGTELPAPLLKIAARMLSNAGDVVADEIFIADQSRWLSVRATRVMLTNSTSAHNHILVLQDVSAQKKFEQEREAARNSMALAEMSSVLAHEIRNPLGAMELFLTLLCQSDLSSEAMKWTDHLTAGVRTLSAIVNNVLQFYTTGTYAMSEIDVDALIGESTRFLEPVAQESSISLEIAASAGGLRINGDEQALRQVLLNLCGNAVRHSSPGGLVTIQTRTYGVDRMRVEVSDQGTGIAPEHLQHIFEAGFSASGRSSGLGLAVCKRIVEAHGGTIGVLHSDCQGTTMYVELPRL